MTSKYKFDIAMSAIISEKVAIEILTKEIEKTVCKRVNRVEAQYDADNKFVGFQAFFDHDADVQKPSYRSSSDFVKWNFDQER